MTDRYQVNTSSGELGIRTNSLMQAAEVAEAWKTTVIDLEAA